MFLFKLPKVASLSFSDIFLISVCKNKENGKENISNFWRDLLNLFQEQLVFTCCRMKEKENMLHIFWQHDEVSERKSNILNFLYKVSKNSSRMVANCK